VLARPSDASYEGLRRLRNEGFATVVLVADEATAADAERVRAHGLALAWWVEVARCPELADARPELMASLQGHDDWRRLFPGVAPAGPGTVTKAWPWVPVTSREGFDAQRARVLARLRALPAAGVVFLSGLQGAPSACGCGSSLCRWTADYGDLRTNTPLAADAAARFVAEIAAALAPSEVVPVWVTECEPADPACGSVPCYSGKCWRAFAEQWRPLARGSETVAMLLSARSLGRAPGWPARAAALLGEQTAAAPAHRLLAVIDEATDPATLCHCDAVVVVRAPIDQRFEPRLVALGK